jgi:hypothetical protein
LFTTLIEDFALKRIWLFVLMATLALCLPSYPAHGQLPAAVANYGREFAKDVAGFRAEYIAATNGIPLKYKRDLEALQAKFQKAGDLDGLLAVKKEIDRYQKAMAGELDPFETVPEMTANVIVTSPQELRKLQEQYVASFTEAATTLKTNISERGEKYRAQIKSMQTALTRAGKIDEAIAVRNESDRVAKILDSGDISELLGPANLPPSAESQPQVSQPTPRRDPGNKPQPSATKWTLRATERFSRDLPRYFAPDVPDELTANYNSAKAIGSLSGRCTIAAAQVGDVLCSWNGRAFIWDVASVDDLATDIRVKSRTISTGANNGPHLELAVLANGVRVKSISVPVCKADDLVRIVRDKSNGNRFLLFWPTGSERAVFEVPAGAKLRVLIGAVLHNPGETCDLSFQLVPPGAK